MSQIELGEEASPAPIAETDLAEEQAEGANPAIGGATIRQRLHSTYQSIAPSRSTVIDPSRRTCGDTANRAHVRRVGGRYLAQLAFTTIPLILVDLVLLATAIVVARGLLRYINIGTGIDVSAFLTPIAVGFVLIAVELGLYPGIRLGPVEEFRRLAVSATLIFGLWTAGVVLLTGGLQSQVADEAASSEETEPLGIKSPPPTQEIIREGPLVQEQLAADTATQIRPNKPVFLSLAYVLSLTNLWVFVAPRGDYWRSVRGGGFPRWCAVTTPWPPRSTGGSAPTSAWA